VPNSSAQYPTVEVTSAFTNWTESGQVYVPATPEVFTYDADGNLTSDGRWAYTWDGENRLIEMKRDAVSPSGARIWLVFEYDAQSRRIRKTVSTYAAGGWAEQTDAVILYDGWNVMAELDANAGKVRLRTYVWGIDLSGSLQGAGGVGGLLWVSNYQTAYQEETLPTGVHFVAYDGNGNVMALVKAADGTVSGRYEYGPFAERVRVGGALAKAQPFRFSTKWTDAESGLLYYGYRYYNPNWGRWLSVDPLGESASGNLFGLLNNRPSDDVDVLGRSSLYLARLDDWQRGLKESTVIFRQMLSSLCPEVMISWTTKSGITQCCSRTACYAQADQLARDLSLKYGLFSTASG
jgi:RHS repeat-associated protein